MTSCEAFDRISPCCIQGDEDWLVLDKKVLKHDWPKNLEHLELEFRIQYYPMDVTQVLQYVTLYQVGQRRRLTSWGKQSWTTSGMGILLCSYVVLLFP